MMFTKTITSPYADLSGLTTYCGALPVSEWPADQRQARDRFFQTPSRHLSHFTVVNDLCLRSLGHGKHLVQAFPPVSN